MVDLSLPGPVTQGRPGGPPRRGRPEAGPWL